MSKQDIYSMQERKIWLGYWRGSPQDFDLGRLHEEAGRTLEGSIFLRERYLKALPERNFWINHRSKKEAENNKVEKYFQLSINEERLTLSYLTGQPSQLKESRSRLIRELAKAEAELACTTDECEGKAGRLERIEQDYYVSRQKRAEAQQNFWIKMRRFFRQKKGEDPDAPNNRGPESEGIILPEELPELASTSNRLATQQESPDSSSGTAHPTVEVQPRPDPTRQPELHQVQQVQQVEKHISVPSRPSAEQCILLDTTERVAERQPARQPNVQNEMEPERQSPMESLSVVPHKPIVDLPRRPPNHPSAELDGSAKDHQGSDPVHAP
ncbi:hypothetical protein F53441_1849 [Fusarium austroafricanum]|uniref:Uncharacterized protein n=1 Tax=Fusarium austroafricanum TaxID=2364996 RepID=A0A8H4PCQ2_9HYPO|nr:hypothetical protein F53441_1849 [Fusarium austroafricanum]